MEASAEKHEINKDVQTETKFKPRPCHQKCIQKVKKNPSERNPNIDYKNREVIIFGTAQGLERHEGSKLHEIQVINETVQRNFDELIWQNDEMKPTELSIPEGEDDLERQYKTTISAKIERIAELESQAAADKATFLAQSEKVADLENQASENRATLLANSEKIGEGERFEKKAEEDIKLAEKNGAILALTRSTFAFLVGINLLPMTGLECFTPAVVEESHLLRLRTLLANKTIDHGAAELESGTMDICESLDSVEKVGGMDFSIYVNIILAVVVVWLFLAVRKRDNQAKERSENHEEQLKKKDLKLSKLETEAEGFRQFQLVQLHSLADYNEHMATINI